MIVSRPVALFIFAVFAAASIVGCSSSAIVADDTPAREWQILSAEIGTISCDRIMVVSDSLFVALTEQTSDTLTSANVLEIRQFREAQTTTGMLVGMAVGGVLGYAAGPGEKPKPPSDGYFNFDLNIGPSKKSISAIGGVLLGGAVGGLIGSTTSGDKVFDLKSVPPGRRGYVIRSWFSD